MGHLARMPIFPLPTVLEMIHNRWSLSDVLLTDRGFNVSFVEETKSRRSRVSMGKSSSMGKKGIRRFQSQLSSRFNSSFRFSCSFHIVTSENFMILNTELFTEVETNIHLFHRR